MRRAVLAALTAVSFLLVPAAEAAGPVTTKVGLDLFTTMNGTVYALGSVSSPEERCVAGREVEVYLLSTDGGPVYIDTARSGDRGGWGGIRSEASLPNNAYNAVRLVVLKSTVKVSKHKRITCGGKTKTASFGG
ncbi:MAG: hypothetical protein U0R51_01765 [Solirubrobacterales bacterium]